MDIEKQNNKKQNTIIFLCWLIYTIAYLGRYSYNSNITRICDYFGKDTSQTGLIATCFFIAYGVGQVVNGICCKYYPKHIMLPLSLLLSSVINIVVALGASFEFYKWLWLLNGATQSILWSSLVLTLSENLDDAHLNKAIVLMGTCVPVGTFLAYGASALFSTFTSFKPSFVLAAVCMSAVAIFCFISYRRNLTPELALKADKKTENVQHKKADASLIAIIVVLCVFAIACNLVKDGLQTWAPSILKNKFGLPNFVSILSTLVLPLVGTVGMIIATKLNSMLKRYELVIGIMFLVCGLLLVASLFFINVAWIPLVLAMAISFCMTQGINGCLTTIAPLGMRDKINSATLTGIINGFCYVGSAISGYGIGKVVENSGNWSNGLQLLMWISMVVVVIAIVFYAVSKIKSKKSVNKTN